MDLPKVLTDARVTAHRCLADDVKELVVHAPEIAREAEPGQFIHLKAAEGEPLLRRPISISSVDVKAGMVSLIYRVLGRGTNALAKAAASDKVNCLGPLGRGFALDCKRPLLVGGGMGIAPLIFLAGRFAPQSVDVLIGGRNRTEMFWLPMFAGLAKGVHVTTDDGSMGTKGFTVDLLPELLKQTEYDRVFVCGPERMMEAVAAFAEARRIPCQVSLEKRMACGVGACLSCTCESKDGGKRKKVCTDGPVFWAREVL